MKKQESKTIKTRWHRLLGRLLKELLAPAGITVLTDVPVMNEPPEADILLIRREKPGNWTKDQKARLPDGIRDTGANHILLEFKYSESINKRVFQQTICYDYLYKSGQKMKPHEVRTFIVSAKTPRETTLKEFDYFTWKKPGVYHSKNKLLKKIPLILLNELSDESHNAWIKCFASREKEKKSAFNILNRHKILSLNIDLRWVVEGLLFHLLKKGGQVMEEELTPEKIIEDGKKWHNIILSGMDPEDVMSKFSVEDRLKGLSPEDILKGLSPEYLEKYLKKIKVK